MSAIEITKENIENKRNFKELDKESIIEYKAMLLQYKIIEKAIKEGEDKIEENEKLDVEGKKKTFEFMDYCYNGFNKISALLEKVINQRGMYEGDEEKAVELTDKFMEELQEKSLDYITYMVENDKIDALGGSNELITALQSINSK